MDLPRLMRILREDEGFRQFLYHDTKGIPSIGYGRNLRDTGVSQDEAETLLINDVARAERQCQRYIGCYFRLPEEAQMVLVCLAFSMGIGNSGEGLLSFRKMLTALEKEDFEAAATELLDSQWRHEVGFSRSQRMAEMLRSCRK